MALCQRLLQNSSFCLAKPITSVASLMTSSEEILIEKFGSKRIVTLNRPKALNALNLSMVREIYPQLKKWENSTEIKMIIIKGSGEKAFCAGGDVLAVIKSAKEAQRNLKADTTLHKDFFREEYQLNHLIGSLTKPYVAFIDGIVMGGGCGLSVNGQFRVSTEKTMLAMPETALGLFPDVGGSYFLSRLKDNLGMYLALTGYRLQGADAFHSGLASHYVPSSELPSLQEKLIQLENVTEQSVDSTILSFEPCQIPAFSLEEHIPKIRSTFHGKTIEHIIDNLEKDGSAWAQTQLKTLSKMSPTSLKVTFRQIENGAKMSYAKIFTMEYRLTQRFLADHDFHEGCRAILIDKDRKPKWNPAELHAVTEATLDSYFAPLPHGQDLILYDD
ncbi:unnamed protein product [Auanema sp. JU1783]|nr:unnamed protein product [Auanema sp. JU1783]